VTAPTGAADARVPGYLGRVLDENSDPVGTCFQVAAGVLVTAWHVLDDIGATAENARVRIDPLASGEAFEAAVARLDQDHDLAVLVSERHLSASAEELTATDRMAPRTAVTVTGHSVITDSGRTARSLTTIGRWTGPATWEDAPPAGRMTAEALMPGMSGAPVIRDSDAAVAGVVSGRYNSADDWLRRTVWVVRTEDLAVLLDGIAAVALKQPLPAAPVAGRPLAEVADPFVLEVHRPVVPEDAPPGLPVLPPYVPREHDQVLGQVVAAAAGGRSGIAVLVGGSSTGKTRACWEALARLRDQVPPWRLWHPIDPSRPDAALRELPGIGPRTVVWLNEAQFYLDPAEAGLGEKVAAGLRELLRDPGRAPVLVLATVWPGFWATLTVRPAAGEDQHPDARELLAGHDIPVPAKFTLAQLSQLTQSADVRMRLAAGSAPDGEVIQFLAGAPELLARYRNAPPAARALIEAAMDARRLGMGVGLPQAFLEDAAPGYLTDAEWDALSEDWLEQALAYTKKDAKGVGGPLTRIRPRPARPAARNRGDQPASVATAAGPLYRLADYLDQHVGSTARSSSPRRSSGPQPPRTPRPATRPRSATPPTPAAYTGTLPSCTRTPPHPVTSTPPFISAIPQPACARTLAPRTGPPLTPPSTTRATWAACWTACARRARKSKPPRWPPGPPPTPPSTPRAAWPCCWRACSGRMRTTRPLRWPPGPPPTPPSPTRTPWPAC
jgi:hypothetical protein